MSLKRFGIVGAVIAALCCFTPLLVVLSGAVGLSWLVGYLDYVLFPTLNVFAGITVYARWRERAVVRQGEEC
jgi:mercuric ion transport protein